MESGGKDQSGLAAKTVAAALSLTKAVIKYASRMKYVTDRTALDVSVKARKAALPQAPLHRSRVTASLSDS